MPPSTSSSTHQDLNASTTHPYTTTTNSNSIGPTRPKSSRIPIPSVRARPLPSSPSARSKELSSVGGGDEAGGGGDGDGGDGEEDEAGVGMGKGKGKVVVRGSGRGRDRGSSRGRGRGGGGRGGSRLSTATTGETSNNPASTTTTATDIPIRRGPGRPRLPIKVETDDQPVKRGRGRPRGSKSKVKVKTMMQGKEKGKGKGEVKRDVGGLRGGRVRGRGRGRGRGSGRSRGGGRGGGRAAAMGARTGGAVGGEGQAPGFSLEEGEDGDEFVNGEEEGEGGEDEGEDDEDGDGDEEEIVEEEPEDLDVDLDEDMGEEEIDDEGGDDDAEQGGHIIGEQGGEGQDVVMEGLEGEKEVGGGAGVVAMPEPDQRDGMEGAIATVDPAHSSVTATELEAQTSPATVTATAGATLSQITTDTATTAMEGDTVAADGPVAGDVTMVDVGAGAEADAQGVEKIAVNSTHGTTTGGEGTAVPVSTGELTTQVASRQDNPIDLTDNDNDNKDDELRYPRTALPTSQSNNSPAFEIISRPPHTTTTPTSSTSTPSATLAQTYSGIGSAFPPMDAGLETRFGFPQSVGAGPATARGRQTLAERWGLSPNSQPQADSSRTNSGTASPQRPPEVARSVESLQPRAVSPSEQQRDRTRSDQVPTPAAASAPASILTAKEREAEAKRKRMEELDARRRVIDIKAGLIDPNKPRITLPKLGQVLGDYMRPRPAVIPGGSGSGSGGGYEPLTPSFGGLGEAPRGSLPLSVDVSRVDRAGSGSGVSPPSQSGSRFANGTYSPSPTTEDGVVRRNGSISASDHRRDSFGNHTADGAAQGAAVSERAQGKMREAASDEHVARRLAAAARAEAARLDEAFRAGILAFQAQSSVGSNSKRPEQRIAPRPSPALGPIPFESALDAGLHARQAESTRRRRDHPNERRPSELSAGSPAALGLPPGIKVQHIPPKDTRFYPKWSNQHLPAQASAHDQRVQINRRRKTIPPELIRNMPVWAKTRRALTSSLNYMEKPIRTSGGSIDLDSGGVARAVLLEGDVGDKQYVFWGTGRSCGTVVLPLGNSRLLHPGSGVENRRRDSNGVIDVDADGSGDVSGEPSRKKLRLGENSEEMEDDPDPGGRAASPVNGTNPQTQISEVALSAVPAKIPLDDIPPLLNGLPDTTRQAGAVKVFENVVGQAADLPAEDEPMEVAPAATLENSIPSRSRRRTYAPIDNPRKAWEAKFAAEAPEVRGLLLAHRARTPVALFIAEDYGVPPWQVPQPFVGLGWFWITDAWLEPVGKYWINYTGRDPRDPAPLDEPDDDSDCPVPGGSVQPSLGGPGNRKRKRAEDPAAKSLKVRWRFRFDWCTDTGLISLPEPWWEHMLRNGVQQVYEARAPQKFDEPNGWSVIGPDIYKTEAVWLQEPDGRYGRGAFSLNERGGIKIQGDSEWIVCQSCKSASLAVYSEKGYCLNEDCESFFREPHSTAVNPRAKRSILLRPPRHLDRISPTFLKLTFRPPPLPDNISLHDQDPVHLGRDLWRGWVCSKCGMANERRTWLGWDCDNCGNSFRPEKTPLKIEDVLPASQRIYTGPRPDCGFPQMPEDVVMTQSIYSDGIKIVMHGLEDGQEIHHVCVTEQTNSHGDKLFLALQRQQPPFAMPFKRVPDQDPKTLAHELALAPFYSFTIGPPDTPLIETIPSFKPIWWDQAPDACFKAISHVNQLGGRVHEGHKEFNSVVTICMPPNIPAVLRPWMLIPPNTIYAVLSIGHDTLISFRRPERKQARSLKKLGEVTGKHGDTVFIKTTDKPVEVGMKQLGFGFVAIARQVYADSGRQVRRARLIRDVISTEKAEAFSSPSAPAPSTTTDTITNTTAPPPAPAVPAPALREWPVETTEQNLLELSLVKAKATRTAAKTHLARLKSWQVWSRRIEDQGWRIGKLELWPKGEVGNGEEQEQVFGEGEDAAAEGEDQAEEDAAPEDVEPEGMDVDGIQINDNEGETPAASSPPGDDITGLVVEDDDDGGDFNE